MKRFWKYYLRRWKIEGAIPADLKKMIVAVAPHTSNRDFMVGLAVRSIIGLDYIRFLGKKELFRKPYGWLFRRLGGTPVERGTAQNLVSQVVQKFMDADTFILALAPEGTRSKVDRLRSGFYHIALQASVPIIMVGFDYARKVIAIAPAFYPTGQEAKDMQLMISFWAGIQGKIPENGVSHLVKDES